MNIRDIITQNVSGSGRSTAFGTDSFLRIGRRGDVVDGVLSVASDQVSIRFGTSEVSVPAASVHNAADGETRSFRIMEVSKEKIVLKEVGTAQTSGYTEPMVGTKVSAASSSFRDCLRESGQAAEAKQLAGQNIAVLTGEDYQALESQQGALEEYEAGALDRAIERHKEHRQWQQENAEQNIERSKQFQETIQTLQAQGVTALMSPEEIAQSLREADLPVTDANVTRVASAAQMAEILPALSLDARAYLLENQMAPTIENIYHGQYSSFGAVSADAADPQVWEQLQGQMEQLLAEQGLGDDPDAMGHAKWLFANDLPVTLENVRTMQTLDQIQKEMTPQKLMEQMVYAMQAGAAPEQASLDDRQLVIARRAVQGFAQASPEDAAYVVQEMGQEVSLQTLRQAADLRKSLYEEYQDLPGGNDETIRSLRQTVQNTGGAAAQPDATAGGQADADDGQDAKTVTAQRQLEEIRLKLTLQSAVRMERKGIVIETAPLQDLVEQLRAQEKEYYRQITPGTVWEEETLDAVQETIEKADQVREAPAQILGIGVRQHSLLTMNVLHSAAVSRTVQTEQYQSDYEKVGTQVRQDLGDSIRKAFQNIPQLLQELGLEDTPENQRAVRILGYNEMEVTEENIGQIKRLDAQVNSILAQMKPATVLELVRAGEDPLDLPLAQLEERLQEISSQQEISPEERYSRFLWKLEQQQGITQQEREGYIGIYRLLHQVEQSDGAAIGSVMESGREMTLRNLLTAVRTRRSHGVDAVVDDAFGGLMDLRYSEKNITEQIAYGFAQGDNPDSEDADRQAEIRKYYERLAQQSLRQVSPEALRQMGEDGVAQILDQSLESFHAQVTSGKDTPEEQQLYRQMAQQLRENMEHSEEGARYLQEMGITETVANIQAAERLVSEGYDVCAEIDKRKKRLPQAQQEELEQAESDFVECLEDADQAQEGYHRLESLFAQVLQNSYESKSMTGEELGNLRRLSQGIALQGSMARRHSYDVPIETQDGVAALNVTLIQGSGDSGKVEIFFGEMSAEFRIRQQEAKGLILCGDREMYDLLSQQTEGLSSSLEEQGFTVKDISYTMDRRSRISAAAGASEAQTPARDLYRVAQTVVRHMMHCFQEVSGIKQEVNYEN